MSKKTDIAVLQKVAASKNGELLSTEYKDAFTKLKWLCKICQKTFDTRWNDVQQGHWCPNCVGLAIPTIEDVCAFATSKVSRDGKRAAKCVSLVYVNTCTKLDWICEECEKGFTAIWSNVHKKSNPTWCPYCGAENRRLAAESRRLGIDKMQTFALSKISRDGLRTAICNSIIYIDNKTKLDWTCQECSKRFDMSWNDIQQDHWCPHCLYKHQTMCKEILEKLLNTTFGKLTGNYSDINNKERKIFFDGYNKKYKIAFEYDGYQHYEYPNCYHKTKEQFNNQQQRDIEAHKYCWKNDITLIVIPYWIEDNKLEVYIKDQLIKADLYNELNTEVLEYYD